MAMPVLDETWTAERVRALPDDGKRYECIDGVLVVTPSPRTPHQRVVTELLATLHFYARRVGGYEAFSSPSDIELDPRTLVQPDVFVVPFVNGRRFRTWPEIPLPALVIEVLSPSTARVDRGRKRQRFQRAGVPEFWIVDVDAALVERWRPTDERPEVVSGPITWQPPGAAEPYTFDLPACLAEWDAD
jgi:Uma2 family endonuclease